MPDDQRHALGRRVNPVPQQQGRPIGRGHLCQRRIQILQQQRAVSELRGFLEKVYNTGKTSKKEDLSQFSDAEIVTLAFAGGLLR